MRDLKSGLLAVDLLDVEKNYPEHLGKIRGAFELLEGMGLLKGSCRIEIWSGGSGGALGAYDPGGRLIKIFEDCMVAGYGEMTVIHEYGHHLSLENGETWIEFTEKIRQNSVLLDWWMVVEQTSVYKKLNEIKRNLDLRLAVRDHARYLNDPRELFARSFSQWVTLRSGVALLDIQHLGAFIESEGLFGWSAEEFEPIARCMDGVFLL
jgi:hypothetical protein